MKTGFLEEAPGEKSWIRLQSLLFTALTIFMASASLYREVSLEIFVLVLTAAVAPKVIQKFSEQQAERTRQKQEGKND